MECERNSNQRFGANSIKAVIDISSVKIEGVIRLGPEALPGSDLHF